MGVIRHELVLIEAVGQRRERVQAGIEALRAEMPEQFRPLLVGPIQAPVNGYVWWALFPDGSKEFWSTSDEANHWRAEFKALAPYDHAIHVAWGDEDPEITDESWT